MNYNPFGDKPSKSRTAVIFWGVLTSLFLGGILTVLVPQNPQLLIPCIVLLSLSILSLIFLCLDILKLEIDVFISDNTSKIYPLCIAYFVVGLIIAYFLSKGSGSVISFGFVGFIDAGALASNALLNSLWQVELNIFSETLLFTALPIGMSRLICYVKKWDTQKFILLAIIFSIVIAVLFHSYSHGISLAHLSNAIPSAVLFSVFTGVALYHRNILTAAALHSSWNLGLLLSLYLTMI